MDADEAAFDAFVRAHHPELMRFALARTHERHTAEDAVQEAWLVFIERFDAFEGRSTLRTFVFGILVNVLRARARSRRWAPYSDELTHGQLRPWPNGEDSVWEGEIREALRSAIEALPDLARDVITLRDVLGWDAAEICALLAIGEAHFRVILHRARVRVRARIDASIHPTTTQERKDRTCAPT